MTSTQTQPSSSLSLPTSFPAMAADLVGLLLLIFLFNPLRSLFEARTIRGGMYFLVTYIVFALAVNVLKRLEQRPGPAADFVRLFDYTGSPFLKVFLALIVIAGFVVVEIDLNRATDSMIELMSRPEFYGNEGEITLYYSFGPLFLWLMIGVLYLAALLLPTQQRIAAGSSRYALTEFVALSLINVMLVMSAAYLAAAFSRMGSFNDQPLTAGILALLVLEIVFDPARLRHALKQPLWLPIMSFFTLVFAAATAVALAMSG